MRALSWPAARRSGRRAAALEGPSLPADTSRLPTIGRTPRVRLRVILLFHSTSLLARTFTNVFFLVKVQRCHLEYLL